MRALHHQVLDAHAMQTLIEHTGSGVAERFLNDYLDLCLPGQPDPLLAWLQGTSWGSDRRSTCS